MGLSAPKATPPAIVKKLGDAVREAMAKPDLVKKLELEGMTPMTLTADEFVQLVKSDTERWGQLTRSLNIRAN